MVKMVCVEQQINSYRILSAYGWIPLSQFVAIFLLEDIALLLYTLLILKSSQIFKIKKKCDQVSEVGPAMAGPTGPVPPGLTMHSNCCSTLPLVQVFVSMHIYGLCKIFLFWS